MIANERQYKITKAALAKLQESIKDFDSGTARRLVGDPVLVRAQLEALQSESEVLSDQLREYEVLKSGSVEDFTTNDLRELPSLLVKARIAKGMSQRQLAEKMGLKEQQIQRYEAEEYSSASLRRIIEVADALGLRVRKHARLDISRKTQQSNSKTEQLDFSRFPLREMYRRGWFPDFIGAWQDVKAGNEELLTGFITPFGTRWSDALHRKHVRSGSILDEYALIAWHCRILWLTQKEEISAPFKRTQVTDEWIRDLVRLSARENSAQLARDYLRNSGITLVVEPHLPQTFLDGAALWFSTDRPIIAMTLRYDRLDNFWFVLMHELAHLMLHHQQTQFAYFFDDLDAPADELEREADEFAEASLIPPFVWETAIARYLRTSDSVNQLADELSISPALVAGRIQNESDNYIILRELIGLGTVRQQFPEVRFGQ